jgi:hypothetical protein
MNGRAKQTAFRFLISLACLVAFWDSGSAAADPCPNEALRVEQHATYLPGCGAYELVSPADKNGGDVLTVSSRTPVALGGGRVAFASLSAFAGAEGTGITVDYLAEREGGPEPGAGGWLTRPITPPQDPTPLLITGSSYQAQYALFTPELSAGVFQAVSPLGDEPYVGEVPNLYLGQNLPSDLRTYVLATACPLCVETETPLPPLLSGGPETIAALPYVAALSPDGKEALFSSPLRLTGDSTGNANFAEQVHNLYLSDDGATQLVGLIPASGAECSGAGCVAPTPPAGTVAGQGASGDVSTNQSVPHVLSADGSRIQFTVYPHFSQESLCTLVAGACGNLYERDLASHPPGTVQVNVSERSEPEAPRPAAYWDASADGSRVFFITEQRLTDSATLEPTLYMWDEHAATEVQELTVQASGGTFALSYEGESTPALPHDAGAAEIEAALDQLPAIEGVGGSVSISGDGPFEVTFGGALASSSVPEIEVDGSNLDSGTTDSAEVAHGGHLTLIAPAKAVTGMSEDGHSLYFASSQQLVAGEPPVGPLRAGLFLWQDGVGAPQGGELRYVGEVLRGDLELDHADAVAGPQAITESRVTPDGRYFLFDSTSGANLLSLHGGTDYDQTSCPGTAGPGSGCRELYLYDASGNQLHCVSCRPGGDPAAGNATVNTSANRGQAGPTLYQNRAITNDGRFVFFSTTESLVPQDTNGYSDAYEYETETGEVHLLSSGTEESGSYFMDASADGADAFIATRQRLVGGDHDRAYDLYDVRVNGGFPEPAAGSEGCGGESSCRPPPTPPQSPPPASSASFVGPGNPPSTRRRHKHHRKRHGHHGHRHGRHHG